MNIIYKSDDFDIPTNINDKIYFNKEGGGGIIYLLKNNNKELILKIFSKDRKDCFISEKNHYFNIQEKINNHIINQFMINYLAIIEYENEYIIFMDKMDNIINKIFLNNISNIEQKNILFQILNIIFFMNNVFLIYFNDLFTEFKLKNITVLENNINSKLVCKYKNKKIIINIEKYIVKFIDYGFINNNPSFNTIKYMKKYFNELYNENIISEILLYTLFYYKELYKEIDINSILNNLNNIIKNIYKKYEKNYINKNFDLLLLEELYNNLYK